jgi:alpha-mannosidase
VFAALPHRQFTDAADFAYTGPTDIHVRDLATGQDTPHQFLTRSGSPHLRILARDVPSAGYKVVEILPEKGTTPTDAAATFSGEEGCTLETDLEAVPLNATGALPAAFTRQQIQTYRMETR